MLASSHYRNVSKQTTRCLITLRWNNKATFALGLCYQLPSLVAIQLLFMGIPRPAWPEGITPEDDEEPVQELHDEEPVHVERRVLERLKLKCFKKKPESGPGLTEDDVISIE
ncbi:hypothetical protein Tco_1094350 [Tanacetum coccineum]|uniref:Uncharacterized protein n=1 Tax=Tanacetum coccineum TaxID=301880 RepID=A0ABQ5IHD2_9ASTR